MIVGLGLDLVEMDRIQRIFGTYGLSFMRKILRPEECAALETPEGTLPPTAKSVQYLASRFAAKEAAVKALGTGFSGGIGPHDISVTTDPSGKPELLFHGKAQDALERIGGTHIHLTITHCRHTAGAVVVIENRAR